MNTNTLISQADAARALGLTRQAIAYLIRAKRLQFQTVAGRRVLTIGEIARYKQERVPPGWAGYNAKYAKKKGKNDTKKKFTIMLDNA
jgi:hypothetical protein